MKKMRMARGTGVRPWVCFVLVMLSLGFGFARAISAEKQEGKIEKKPPLKKVGEGQFEIGEVRLDQKKRTVSFAGTVHMTEGVIEYAVVGMGGKLHEALLVTKAEAQHVHVAMLLMGVKDQSGTAPEARVPLGEFIQVWVHWEHEGKEKRARLDQLICIEERGEPMGETKWIYNGSRAMEGKFMAQAEESIVAIIEDMNALVNSPHARRVNDEIWYPCAAALPKVGTPVRIMFELSKAKADEGKRDRETD